jgi:hypothetical protein
MHRYSGKQHSRCWRCPSFFGSAIARIAASTIVMTGCVADQPTTPSLGSTPRDASLDQVSTAAAGTISLLTLVSRNGSVLNLGWDWPAWSPGFGPTHHYVLSFAGRSVVLNTTGVQTTLDVSHADLTPGHSYTLTLRAIDAAGNATQPARLPFETTPPSPPTNLRLVSKTSGYPDSIALTPGTDNGGPIRRYEVVVDGVLFGVASNGTGLVAGTKFSLLRAIMDQLGYPIFPCGRTFVQLRAFDQSLNPSPQLSAPLTVFFPDYAQCPPPHRDA